MGKLSDHRKTQRLIAISRDSGRCVYCHYVLGRERYYDHVHHVYGRGTKASDWRESYDVLLCLCLTCHTMLRPLRYKRGTPTFHEQLLARANKEPINCDFEHPKKENTNW
jgi:hypothetical protein